MPKFVTNQKEGFLTNQEIERQVVTGLQLPHWMEARGRNKYIIKHEAILLVTCGTVGQMEVLLISLLFGRL